MRNNSWVIAVDRASFANEVLERSKTIPVLVDFWATWCGPCRTLGPILEKLVKEMGGQFILAKIDSDRNPDLARQYGVRGIPSVKLFVNQKVVDEFTGALPESQIRRFLDKALPSSIDKQVALANEAAAQHDFSSATALYQAVLTENPAHVGGLLGLTRVLLATGQTQQANETFACLKPQDQESPIAKSVAAQLAFANRGGVDLFALQQKVQNDPGDLAARLALGEALAALERYEESLEQFLEVVRQNRKFSDDAGRKAIIRVFDLLGSGHPLIARFRPRLSALLFV